MAFLEPGETCWRSEPADRVAFLVDTQAYFTAARLAMSRAQRSILLIGWSFDPRTRLQPDGIDADPDEPDSIGHMLIALGNERPDLDIRVLMWKSALPIAISQEFFPHRAQGWFRGTRVKFRLDDTVPMGGCHHQKVLVVDDKVAFCGGGDISIDRWDTTAHLDIDSRRLNPDHAFHAPRHEVVMMVDGKAAVALADLVRERWLRATGDTLATPLPTSEDPWPVHVRPNITNVDVCVVRSEPAWGRPAVHEWRKLTLRSIALAKRLIYLENQYFTSPVIAEALAKRLAEPDGPEVVLISTEVSPSYFDKATMDRTRAIVLRRLREADVFGRFRAFFPSTSSGRAVVVHAKVTIIDDTLVRIGSANLNNRSGGVDTECELAIEASNDEARAAITHLRNFLAGHYVGRGADDVAHAMVRQGAGLIGAIEALNHHGRLQPIAPLPLGRLTRVIAAYHLGDAADVDDLWRPWKRRRMLDEEVRVIAAGGTPEG